MKLKIRKNKMKQLKLNIIKKNYEEDKRNSKRLKNENSLSVQKTQTFETFYTKYIHGNVFLRNFIQRFRGKLRYIKLVGETFKLTLNARKYFEQNLYLLLNH